MHADQDQGPALHQPGVDFGGILDVQPVLHPFLGEARRPSQLDVVVSVVPESLADQGLESLWIGCGGPIRGVAAAVGGHPLQYAAQVAPSAVPAVSR